ncbi:MAG: sulfatase-like hydrolase/transferase [Verrucomicrobiales bacterium]|nr:sulfatase-like hydrolase/transferase [Verrucomicrobiales bacterium]
MHGIRLFFLGLTAITAATAADARRPNILFLFSDDQSYKTVSCYPEALPGVHTPNIDALAAQGIRFSYAYMGSWCMPSRASLLTGRHPHGIESMRMEGQYPGSAYDPQQCPFWPSVFRQQGYQTAHIGKWHTGIDAGWNRDWDYQIVWNRPKHPDNSGAYFYDEIVAENGVERVEPGYSTDKYSEWACDYIRGKHRDPDKPWYLWLCYGAIHGPTTPADRHKGKHREDPVRIPADIFGPRPGKPDYLNKTQAWKKGKDGQIYGGKSGAAVGDGGNRGKTFEDFVHQSNDCVEALDEGIGQVLAALKESGQLENTLVVFTADQGFGMGEHGFRMKLGPWDATYRSPMVVSMPGTLPEGKVCPHPVHGVDLVRTFLATAGIDTPWEMHGRDLTPLLQDPESARWDPVCFYEHTGQSYGSDVAKVLAETPEKAVHNNVPWYGALNDGRWKYIRYLKAGETEELYDLQTDPEELNNLADDPAHAQELTRLRKRCETEWKRTGASFADHLPPTRQMQQGQ